MSRLQALNKGAWWSFVFNPIQKQGQIGMAALDLNEDALRRIDNPAPKPYLGSQTIDEWPEADPLDRSADYNP